MKIIVFFLLLVTACSQENTPQTSQVTFTFNNKDHHAKNRLDTKSINALSAATLPGNTGEVNCFGIIANYPELGLLNYCETVGAGIVKSDERVGMVPFGAGGSLTMDVKIGAAREFYVIGWNTEDGCHPMDSVFFSNTDNITAVSSPVLLGKSPQVNVGYAPIDVPINVNSTIDATAKLTNCFGNLATATTAPMGPPLNGLVRWYDASDSSTLFTDAACSSAVANDGEAVQCWKDKAGISDAIQTTPGYEPTYVLDGLNSMPSLDFGQIITESYLNTGLTTLNNPSSIFVAYKIESTPMNAFGTFLGASESVGAGSVGFGISKNYRS